MRSSHRPIVFFLFSLPAARHFDADLSICLRIVDEVGTASH